jgi:hypothetical protein
MKHVAFALSLFLALPIMAQDGQPTSKPATDKPADVKAPSGPVTKEAVTFKKTVPQPGEVRIEKATMKVDMKMSIDMGGQKQDIDQKMEQSYQREVTITGAEADGTITGLKVTFTKFKQVQQMGPGGGGNDNAKKLEGKTFVVETDENGTRKIQDEAGAKVEDFFVRNQVEQVAKSISKQSKGGFAGALPKGELKPGTKLQLPEEIFRAMMDMKNDKAKFTKKDFTYKGTRDVEGKKCGVFDVRIEISESGRGPEMKLTMGGEVALDLKTGRMLSTNMAGKISLSSSDPNGPQMSGGGTISIKQTVGYP